MHLVQQLVQRTNEDALDADVYRRVLRDNALDLFAFTYGEVERSGCLFILTKH